MSRNFNEMMNTATENYGKMVAAAYKIKNGELNVFDEFIELITKDYHDKTNLIFEMCSQNVGTEEAEIQIPSFACRIRQKK